MSDDYGLWSKRRYTLDEMEAALDQAERECAMTDEFDEEKGRELRDAALMSVSSRPWHGQAIDEIAKLPVGWSGLGEDFRVYVSRRIGPPDNSNAIGALIMDAARMGLICRTGNARGMRLKRSHARNTPEWQRV